MQKRLVSSIVKNILSILALAVCSCNNDIFVDKAISDADVEFSVEGDGGSKSFDISTKHLEHIRIVHIGGHTNPYKYYNHAGQEISDNSPASEVSKISYEGLLARFEVLINGNQLTFTSIESADIHYTVTIVLDYSYVTRFFTAEILQGQPLQLVDVTYSDDITVTEDAGTIVSRESLTNKSSLTQILELYPMIDAQGKAYGVVLPEETWARGKTVDMPALQFADGKWSMAEISDVLIGEKYGIIIPNLLEKTSVSVPANSKAVATSTITLTTASVSGKAAFRFPVSGRLLTTRVKCEAMYPSKYEVKTEISDVTN